MSFNLYEHVLYLSERLKAKPEDVSDESSSEEEESESEQQEEEIPYKLESGQAVRTQVSMPWLQQLPRAGLVKELKDAAQMLPILKVQHINGINLESFNNSFLLKDGRALFSSSSIGIIMDPKTREQSFFGGGEYQPEPKFHELDILSLDYSRSRELVASGSFGKQPAICIWCPYKQALVIKFSQGRNTGSVSHIRFNLTGQFLLTVDNSVKRKVHVFETDTGREVDTLYMPETVICVAAGSKFDFALATNKGVFLLQGASKKLTKTQVSKQIATAVAVNQSGQLYFGTLNGMVCKMSRQIAAHEGSVTCLLAINSKIYTCGQLNKTIKIYDDNLTLLSSFAVDDFCKSFDVLGSSILMALNNGKLIFRDQNDSDTVLINAHFAGETWGLAYDQVNQEVITAGDDNKLLVFNLSSKSVVNEIKINQKQLQGDHDLSPYSPFVASQMSRAVDYNIYNEDLAFVCLNGELQVYETSHVHDPKCIIKLQNSWSQVIRYSPSGKYLALGFNDGRLIVLDSDLYKPLFQLSLFQSKIMNLDWSTESNFLRICSADHVLKYVSIEGLEVQLAEIETVEWSTFSKFSVQSNDIFLDLVAPDIVNEVAASHSRDAMVTGTEDGRVRIYKFPAVCGGFVDYKAHSERVVRLAWSKDDKLLFTVGGYDKALIIWKVAL